MNPSPPPSSPPIDPVAASYQVLDAGPETLFTYPAAMSRSLDGERIRAASGRLFVNGTEVSQSITVHAGDVIAVKPSWNDVSGYANLAYSFYLGVAGVTFLAPVNSIEVLPAGKRVGVGAWTSYVARFHFQNGTDLDMAAGIKWTSSDTRIATMSGNNATALALGTTTITASFSTLSSSTKLDVIPVVLEDFTISPASIKTGVGLAQKVIVTGTYTDGSTGDVTQLATWSSNNSQVATVDEHGVITGVAPGSAGVQATIQSKIHSFPVDVTAAGASPGTPMTICGGVTGATRLENGKVLVICGSSSELYDPSTATWSSAGQLPNPSNGAAVARLANGGFFASGGSGASPVTSYVNIYDPTTGTWKAASPMPRLSIGHTATTLQNGRVLVVGGQAQFNPVYSDSSSYDPTTDTWSNAASLQNARTRHTATVLADGKVLVAGGQSWTDWILDRHAVSTVELYDPAADTWTPLAPMTEARFGHTATLLQDQRLLVVGGTDDIRKFGAEIYDPATHNWSPAGTLVHPRLLHSATLLSNGSVMVAGGIGDDSNSMDDVEIFDPATNSWSAAMPLSSPRSGHAAILLSDHALLIIGGASSGSTELYWWSP